MVWHTNAVRMTVKHLYIRTFGCQMNVHDTHRMEDVLRPAGYLPTRDPEEADVILINTCTVREKSRAKVLSAIGRFARLKQKNPELLLGVAGCVAQQEGERLLQASDALDLVFSPDHIAALPALLQQARADAGRVQVGHLDVESYRFLRAVPQAGVRGPTSLVTIQKGCDNHCSYCVVPQVRGPEVSRPAAEIVDEIRGQVADGVREVTLIGQNVNSYKGSTGCVEDFVELLRMVDALQGLWRVRFTTSHPKDFSEALARAFGELRTLCSWLHLPVQSGSSRVLERMNRGYDREHYLKLVSLVRRHCPEITLGTDIIVGYPGETPEDFDDTMSLLEKIRYDTVYSFKYSPRPDTPSAELPDDVPEVEKARRLHLLQARQDEITRSQLARFVDHTVPVLVEGPSRRGPPQLSGRSPGNHVVNFDEPGGSTELVGQLVPVKITRGGGHSLFGVACAEEQDGC